MFICLQTDWGKGNYPIHLTVSCELKHTARFLSAFSLTERKQGEVKHLQQALSLGWLFDLQWILTPDTDAWFFILIILKKKILSQSLHFPS